MLEARAHVGLGGVLEDDRRADGARQCQRGCGVDHTRAQRVVQIAGRGTVVVVQVHVTERRARVGEPGAQRARDGGVADVEREARGPAGRDRPAR